MIRSDGGDPGGWSPSGGASDCTTAGLDPAVSEGGSVGGVGLGGEVATTPPPPPSGGNRYRGCHHLRPAGGPSDPQLQSGGTRAAERTQSNPEIDYCPVCLARKECEILLKRTYSRRNTEVNSRMPNKMTIEPSNNPTTTYNRTNLNHYVITKKIKNVGSQVFETFVNMLPWLLI